VKRKYQFCTRCRRTITENELRRGLHVESKHGLLCATCTQLMDEAQEPAGGAPPPSGSSAAAQPEPHPPPADDRPPAKPAPDHSGRHLERIREQVEAIHRALLFEKTSPWNVIAGVAQCLAIGMLIIAALQWFEGGGSVLNVLMVAVLFQVMALTFFLKAK